jgi:hypothetical protein
MKIFRRRSKRYRTVTETKFRLVRIKNLENEEKINNAINIYTRGLERILNSSMNKVLDNILKIYNSSPSHDEGLENIQKFFLSIIIRTPRR